MGTIKSRSVMTNVEKLEAWFEEEKKNGLVDIKFFPRLPTDPKIDIEDAAGAILELLQGPFEDITGQDL